MRFTFKKAQVAPVQFTASTAAETLMPVNVQKTEGPQDIETIEPAPTPLDAKAEDQLKLPAPTATINPQPSIASLGSSEATLNDQTLATSPSAVPTTTPTPAPVLTPPAASSTPPSPTLNSTCQAAPLWVVRPGVGTSGRAASGSPTKQNASPGSGALGVATAAEVGLQGNGGTPRSHQIHVVSTVLPKGSGLGIPVTATVTPNNRGDRLAVAASQQIEPTTTSSTPVTRINHTSEALPSLPFKGRYVVVRPVGTTDATPESISPSNSIISHSRIPQPIHPVHTPPVILPDQVPAISKIQDVNRRWNEMMEKTTPLSPKSDAPGIYSAPGEITPEPAMAEAAAKRISEKNKQRRNISFCEKVMYRSVSIVTLEKPQQNIMVLRPDGTVDSETQDFWSDDDEESDSRSEDYSVDGHDDGRRTPVQGEPARASDGPRREELIVDTTGPIRPYQDSAIDINNQVDSEGGKALSEPASSRMCGDLAEAHVSRFRKNPQVIPVSPPGYIKSPPAPRRAFTSRSTSGFVSGRHASINHPYEEKLDASLPQKRKSGCLKQQQRQNPSQTSPISNCTVDPVTPFQTTGASPAGAGGMPNSAALANPTPRRGPSITAPMILRNQSHSAPLHRESLRCDLGDNIAYWTDLEPCNPVHASDIIDGRNPQHSSSKIKPPHDAFLDHSGNTSSSRSSIMFSRHPHSAPPSHASDTIKSSFRGDQLDSKRDRIHSHHHHQYDDLFMQHHPHPQFRPVDQATYNIEAVHDEKEVVATARPRVFVVAPVKGPTHDTWTGPRDTTAAAFVHDRDERPIAPLPPPLPITPLKSSGTRRPSLSRNTALAPSAPLSGVKDVDVEIPVPVVLIKMAAGEENSMSKSLTTSELLPTSPNSERLSTLSEGRDAICPDNLAASTELSGCSVDTAPEKVEQKSEAEVSRSEAKTDVSSAALKDEFPATSMKSEEESVERKQEPPPTLLQRKPVSISRASLSTLYASKTRISNDNLIIKSSIPPLPTAGSVVDGMEDARPSTAASLGIHDGVLGGVRVEESMVSEVMVGRFGASRAPSARTSVWSRKTEKGVGERYER
ncbi:hypothetical protein HDU67_002164 [Dinochytrium kinnereticum]|nr:hypothetical protein HDU67_002164 [Dinochytrium kinnereticum]